MLQTNPLLAGLRGIVPIEKAQALLPEPFEIKFSK